jgi:hypothetical protein
MSEYEQSNHRNSPATCIHRRVWLYVAQMAVATAVSIWLAQGRSSVSQTGAIIAACAALAYLLLLCSTLIREKRRRTWLQRATESAEMKQMRVNSRKWGASLVAGLTLTVISGVFLSVAINDHLSTGHVVIGVVSLALFLGVTIVSLIKLSNRNARIETAAVSAILQSQTLNAEFEGLRLMDYRVRLASEDELLLETDRSLRTQRVWRWLALLVGAPIGGGVAYLAYHSSGASADKLAIAGVVAAVFCPVWALLPFHRQWAAGRTVARGQPGFIFERAHLFLPTRHAVIEWMHNSRLDVKVHRGKGPHTTVFLRRPGSRSIRLGWLSGASVAEQAEAHQMCELIRRVVGASGGVPGSPPRL